MVYDDEYEAKPEPWPREKYEAWLSEQLTMPIADIYAAGLKVEPCDCGQCIGWSAKAPREDIDKWLERAKKKES